MSDHLADAMRRLLRKRSAEQAQPATSARATTRRQLEQLEREMQEVRTRVNALFFAVIAANFGEIIARFVTQ